MAKMKWYGNEVKAKISASIDDKLKLAGRLVRDHARKSVSRAQPTSGTKENKRGLDPSLPGEYPKKVRGDLREAIAMEYDKKIKTVRVGTNIMEGKYLELGTRKMARRPWLSMALSEMTVQVRQILGRRRS